MGATDLAAWYYIYRTQRHLNYETDHINSDAANELAFWHKILQIASDGHALSMPDLRNQEASNATQINKFSGNLAIRIIGGLF